MTQVKASFRTCPVEERQKFNKSNCIMPISVGQPIHEGEKFAAVVKLVNRNFKECTILVDDTIQRHNFGIVHPSWTDEQLYNISREEGDKWIERNMKSIEDNLTIPHKIIRWDDWSKDPRFEGFHKKIIDMYNSDPEYNKAINDNVEKFLENFSKKNVINDMERARECCRVYLQEECAVMCMWADSEYDFELYPYDRNPAMDATYEKVIRKEYPDHLYFVSLRFKKSGMPKKSKKSEQNHKETTGFDQKNEAALKNIISNIPGHIYWKNTEGVYLGCNDKQAKSLGMKFSEDVVGKTDFDLPWNKEAATEFRENDLSIMQSGKTAVMEEDVMINGEKKTLISNKGPLIDDDGKTVGILGVSIDITKQKKFEKELLKRTIELDEALSARTEFLNNISHELKIPLHGIINIARELYGQWDQISDSERKDYLKLVINNQDRLMKLVSNLLDLSKSNSGKMHFEFKNYSIAKIVRETVSEFKIPSNNLINFRIGADLEERVRCDANRIKQVIRNLISNALSYAKGSPIEVGIVKEAKDIKFFISDRGVGVPEDELDAIFDSFKQSSRTKSNAKGTGLGLSICKQLIFEHKGEIWAENNKYKGVSFYFTLPHVSHVKTETARKLKVLMIDDEETVLKSGEMMFKGIGSAVIPKESARSALEYLRENHNDVDLILLDLMMPEMSGLEFLKKMYEDDKLKRIPVFLQTGMKDHKTIEECLAFGVVDVMEKPYTKTDLKKITDMFN